MAKVSLQRIVNALVEWQGNVQAAAESLGMRRNSLYERIERAGLDLEAFRRTGDRASLQPFPSTSGVSGPSGSVRRAPVGSDRKSSPVRYKDPARARTVGVMQSTVPEPPFVAQQSKPRGARLRPQHQESLRDGKIKYIARFGREMDEQTLLDRYMDGFAEWCESWVEQEEQGNNGRRRGGGGS